LCHEHRWAGLRVVLSLAGGHAEVPRRRLMGDGGVVRRPPDAPDPLQRRALPRALRVTTRAVLRGVIFIASDREVIDRLKRHEFAVDGGDRVVVPHPKIEQIAAVNQRDSPRLGVPSLTLGVASEAAEGDEYTDIAGVEL